MRIKIRSNGTVWGTDVYDAESGTVMEGVTRIEFLADGHEGKITAVITVRDVEADIVTDDGKAETEKSGS